MTVAEVIIELRKLDQSLEVVRPSSGEHKETVVDNVILVDDKYVILE